MNFRRMLALAAVAAALLAGAPEAGAAQVDCDGIYCFGSGDFSDEALAGICVTQLPDGAVGVVMLGDRVIRPGDILPADRLDAMTFVPARTETDAAATLGYLPIFSDRVEAPAQMTISIRGKENQAPVAEDFASETYKNLPITAPLKVKDPESEAMTFTLIRAPKRGQVELREDGTFTYTPKKNKVGIDSFVYTATDASGKVSRETTVTITIVKPTDSTQYTDTLGQDCRFAAEWMKNTGIFVGERLDGNACFQPDKAVTRGEFLAMLVRTLDIPLENSTQALDVYAGDAPRWLRPYLAAAVRAGICAGLPLEEGFGHDSPITGEEAAVMLQNALDLPAAEETAAMEETSSPGSAALNTLLRHDIPLSREVLTRGDAARALYGASRLADKAPGMVVIARQR